MSRFVTGNIGHLFAGASTERICRVVLDRDDDRLVALELMDSSKGWYAPTDPAVWDDVFEDLRDNDAASAPDEVGLEEVDELPDWARAAAQRWFTVRVLAVSDDGTTRSDLGIYHVATEAGATDAESKVLEVAWDARLDGAGCVPAFSTTATYAEYLTEPVWAPGLRH